MSATTPSRRLRTGGCDDEACRQPWTGGLISSGLDAAKVPVAEEVHRLHESAMWSAQGQFEQTKLWRLANICLGVPAAALAALAGGVGLASDGKLTYASVMALVAAALSAALTTLNPSRRITQSPRGVKRLLLTRPQLGSY